LFKPVVEDLIKKDIYSMTISVLEENKSRLFYEHLGAKKIDIVKTEILDKRLNKLIYGYRLSINLSLLKIKTLILYYRIQNPFSLLCGEVF